jgi:hypothetical protein
MFDEDLDATIDEVAREMTRGELPPDFRTRVIARLESRDGRLWSWRRGWVLSPLAIAAAVLLAVLVVRAPWRSDGRVAPEIRSEVRPKPDPMHVGKNPDPSPSYVGSDFSRIASAGVTSVVRLKPDATYESAAASDLAPGPIQIESLDVEAMESMEVAPLSVDAMESIDVARLDVAPLEVPVIGEQ